MNQAGIWIVALTMALAMPSAAEEPVTQGEQREAKRDLPAPPPEAEAAEPESAQAIASANPKVPMVCKSVEATGSRIRKGRVCKPRSVWEEQERRAERMIKAIERDNSGPVPPPNGGGG